MPGTDDQPGGQPDDETRVRPAYRPPTDERIPLDKPPPPAPWTPQPDWPGAPQQEYGAAPPNYGSTPQYGYPPSQSYGAPEGYGAPPGYPPPAPGYPSPAPADGTSAATRNGRALAVLGLGVSAAGLFALPLATYARFQSNTYFGSVRDFVRSIPDRAVDRFYNGLARVWWDWGLLLAAALLVVLIAVAVVVPAGRLIGILIALVSIAAGVLQAVALAGSADLREAAIAFRKDHSMYEHAASGIWVAFAGFALLTVAGVILAMGRRRA